MYRSFYNYWKNGHESDIKNWESVKSTYNKPGCVLFVATTKKAGKEVLVGAFAAKMPSKFASSNADKNSIPENTYEIGVSFLVTISKACYN